MTIEPDYTKWLSVEAMSPHEFACLCLGIEPTPTPAGAASSSSACPTMPAEIADDLDQREWELDYQRVYDVLSRAIEDGAFPTTPSGRIKPADGVRHLTTVAEAWGWTDQLSAVRFIQRAKASVGGGNAGSRDDTLMARVNELEAELASCKACEAYSTPMLELVKTVIDKFYTSGRDYPKQEEVLDFLVEQKKLSDGTVLSKKRRDAIWAVASHPSQHRGGRKPLKRSGCPKGNTSR